mmetsp:Transcript_2042/g.7476  ORF Transcript_2042/g.7476 Transcript_2042/m.7476 type:complete len:85 (+) Transcript_2042:426-680(+)
MERGLAAQPFEHEEASYLTILAHKQKPLPKGSSAWANALRRVPGVSEAHALAVAAAFPSLGALSASLERRGTLAGGALFASAQR